MTRPKKVVWSLDSMQSGGTELNAVRVAERLDRSRIDLELVCLSGEGPLSERFARADVPVHHFPISSFYGTSTLRQGMRLAGFLRRRRVQVFHAHDLYSNVFALFWARLAGVPRVMGSRRWWLGPAHRAHQVVNRWSYRFAHRVVVNVGNLPELLASREGVPRERIVYIPNFVEASAFDEPTAEERASRRRRLGLPVSKPVLGIVANLRAEKDHPTLLQAVGTLVARGHDVHLAVVGDGGDRDALGALADRLGIGGRVTFTGHLPNRPNLHQLFDVSVLCSLAEAFPNTLLEAMAAGRPVVATDVGGVPELVRDGRSGLLVPPGDPSALAEALATVLSRPDLAEEYGRTGRERASVEFGADTVLDAWHRLYTDEAFSGSRAR